MLFFSGLVGRAQNVALKTNIVYDAFAAPNLGLEIGVSPRWSVELSGNFIDWSVNKHLWKHWLVQPEARYWFCERFAGHFFAMHALVGEYNFGNMSNGFKMLGSDFSGLGDKRYQGWAAGLGIAYGYTWMLSRRWSIEGEIGIGWLYTRYDVFPCAACGSKIANDRVHNYVGPTKAAINIVYVF